jgi:hypothetical protein
MVCEEAREPAGGDDILAEGSADIASDQGPVR